MQRSLIRVLVYIAGLLCLAFGITLNVKTGLGVSPIISVAHVFSVLAGVSIGDAAFLLYTAFVLSEMMIHVVLKRRCNERNLASDLIKDMLQLPLSLLFTRAMNVFSVVIPQLDMLPDGLFLGSYFGRIIALVIAIAATGIGAAASLGMRLVPNPGDGIVQAVSDITGRETGLVKNIFDGVNVLISIILGFSFAGSIVGIGAGTIIAFLGVGRMVALFNRLCLPSVLPLIHDEETVLSGN